MQPPYSAHFPEGRAPTLTALATFLAQHHTEQLGPLADSLDKPRSIAYFSMEIGLDPAIPTYSGGLGVLAGDTLRAAADLGFPMVGVTLLYSKGYFRQHLDEQGKQSETPADWLPDAFLEPLPARVTITIEGRPVQIRAWRYQLRGVSGDVVPVYLLDTSMDENSPWDRTLTDSLYGGDERYRLCQEMVLGLGGVAMLRALGYEQTCVYHMNEGHSALLTLALLEDELGETDPHHVTKTQIDAVRQRCVFTTHTPVGAGHDQFPIDLTREVLGADRPGFVVAERFMTNDMWNMTHLALALSSYVNGVSERHHEVSQELFPGYSIQSITNGVHAATWTSPSFAAVYDRHIPQWRRDNLYLRYAAMLPLPEILEAHRLAKAELLAEVQRRSGVRLDPSVMTIGFARRATAYKRIDLVFSDLERLRRIATEVGPLQIIYGGKAHPHDDGGKELIQRVFKAKGALADAIRIVYLEEYDITLGKLLTSGVDIWLNTPKKPLEASGTSGMKAALNGVPSFSVLDGWWIEGHVEGITGWSIGGSPEEESDPEVEVASLYDKLADVILPLFYQRPDAFAQIMRSAIALNGSFFNTERMMIQYMRNAYQGALGT